MTQRELLQIVERCQLTPTEAVALQRIADELSVSKSSLIRRGVQIIIAMHADERAIADEKVSRMFPIPNSSGPGGRSA